MATTLLLHFNGTNGSTTFTDETGKTVTPHGNAQISTAQSKFGGASGLFDGTGDYLSLADTVDWDLPGDYTIEAWLYTTTTVIGYANAISLKNVSAADGLYRKGSTFVWYESGADRITSSTISTSTWYHVAVVRNSGTTTLYVNGTAAGTYASATSFAPTALYIGSSDSAVEFWTGNIDDLRITKGSARYTSNFTAPASEFNYPDPITVSVGTATITGQAPVVTFGLQDHIIPVSAGAVNISGQSSTVIISGYIFPAAGAVTLSGQSVAISVPKTILVPAATPSITGQSVALRYAIRLTPPNATAAVAGQMPVKKVDYRLSVASGAGTYVGASGGSGLGYAVTQGGMTILGGVAALSQGIYVTVPTGGLTFTGYAPSIPVIAKVTYTVVEVTARFTSKKHVTLKF